MSIEIINTSIIEAIISLQIPTNQTLKQIHLISTLPTGLTYCRSVGAKIKLGPDAEWIKDGIIDNSSDVEIQDEQLINHSQINIILDQSISQSSKDITLEVSLPATVYDTSPLIKQKELELEVQLSTDFKNYSSEWIPLEFEEGAITLYGHSQSYFENELPIEGTLDFCFQMLNTLAPTSETNEMETIWNYQILFPIVEGITLQYPFNVYIYKPHTPLKLSKDYTLRFNYEQNSYLMTLNHKNKLKGENIYLKVPYLLDSSIIKNKILPSSLNQEAELHFYIENKEIKAFNSLATSQIKILETPVSYNIKINSISLK